MADEEKPVEASDIGGSPSELPSNETTVSLERYEALNQAFIRSSSEEIHLREERDALQSKVTELRSTIHTNEILDNLIEPMANRIFVFMCAYCIVVAIAVLLKGRGILMLSDGVVKLLVGSTAVAVIGLVGTIVTGIFANARRRSN